MSEDDHFIFYTTHLVTLANWKATNFASFFILDNEGSIYRRQIIEALFIRDLYIVINRQVKSYKFNLV